MKLLLSGFEPFLNNKINPSFEVLKKLPKDIDGNEINIIELPVTFNESFKVLEKEIKVIKPDIVISFGLAAGREAISLESTAYNLKKSSAPDNNGIIFENEEIVKGANKEIKTSFKIDETITNIGSKDTKVSNFPGYYVCNFVYYNVLFNEKKYGYKGLFIHVPTFESMDTLKMEDLIIKVIKELFKERSR